MIVMKNVCCFQLLALGCVLLSSLAAMGEDAPPTPKEVKVAQPIPGEPQVYKSVAGRDLKLYVVKPADWKATDTRPAVVFFHGGGWVNGGPGQFSKHAQHFATRGMVCVLVEYRLLTDKKAPPTICVQDAKSSMRWVRAHAEELGIDTKRIAAGGGSAGGHLAAFTGMVEGLDDPQDDLKVSPRPAALLLFNPVFDNGPGEWGHERVGERYHEFSPAHNISPDDPPAIVMFGTKDSLVPVATVQRFQAAMQKAGVRCDVIFYEGAKHGFFNSKPFDRQTLLAADSFLVSLGWLPAPTTSDTKDNP